MKLNNYSVNEYTQVLDKLARARTVHSYTYTGYTELSFWSFVSNIFQLITYPIALLVGLIVVAIAKMIYR